MLVVILTLQPTISSPFIRRSAYPS